MRSTDTLFTEVREWIYRNAREIDLNVWRHHFEKPDADAVLDALRFYQNDDGGFGHTLEPDNWNPESSPYTTLQAIDLIREVGVSDLSHPLYQGILRYLLSGKDLAEYGWRFSIPGNDAHPHAPWWHYNEESNRTESMGLTARLAAFALESAPKDAALYLRALELSHTLTERMMEKRAFGDMGIGGFCVLGETLERLNLPGFDYAVIRSRLRELVNSSIERDSAKWVYYGVRPSLYIRTPDSPYYVDNAECVRREAEFLLDTRHSGGVWDIPWSWFDNNERYARAFAISQNWWMSIKATENMRFLRAFGKI